MKSIGKLILVAIIYVLIMFKARNYLADKLKSVNTTGRPYLPSESPKLHSNEELYETDKTSLYEAENTSYGTIE